MLSTNEGEIFLQTKDSVLSHFKHAAETYLRSHRIIVMENLDNGWLAIGTRTGGLVILDRTGELIQIINKSVGLPHDYVTGICRDDQGGLWLSLANGISRIEIPSPYSIFDARLGVEGAVDCMIRYKGLMYAGDQFGLLVLSDNRFQKVGNLQAGVLDLLSVGDTLFVGSTAGTFALIDSNLVELNTFSSSKFLRSEMNPDIIFVGLKDGLAYFQWEENQWKDKGRIDGVSDDIRQIVETDEGELWLESQHNGTWHVVFEDSFPTASVRHFQADRELPRGILFLSEINNEAVFEINGTVYRYQSIPDSIVADTTFGNPFNLHYKIAPKTMDSVGNIWMYAQMDPANEKKQTVVSLLQQDGTYDLNPVDDHRIEGVVRKVLLPEKNGILWFGGPDGIVRQDLKISIPKPHDAYTSVRAVLLNQDSLIYGGTGQGFLYPEMDYVHNSIRFEFSTPVFTRHADNQYQFILRGFDREWSEWTRETKKDYTNLPAGQFIFNVKSRDFRGTISKEGSFEFVILPPWHKTALAYALYGLLFLGLIYLLIQWRSAQLRKEKKKLEILISEKTREIQDQAVKLQELDQIKSRFFANISHEFRTPLTLILGPLEHMIKEKSTLDGKEAETMYRNTRRLERLINQLLELSKMESGILKLQISQADIVKFIKAQAAGFTSHASQRSIDYIMEFEPQTFRGYFDQEKIEIILINLLSNAFKFTPDGREIRISVLIRNEILRVWIYDQGPGIDQEEVPYIFDRFYQGEQYRNGTFEGTGIGLALTKELIDLHRGKISLKSQLGQGSVFQFEIPINKSAYTDKEIVSGYLHPQDLSGIALVRHTEEMVPDPIREEDEEIPLLLIIEDNKELREFIANIFRSEYKIIEAVNGIDGLKLAVEYIPDLVITDVMMPELDGMEFSQRIKSDEKTNHIPVIILTAKADFTSKIEGLLTGADDYLIKPFHRDELRIRVRNLIDQRRKLQEKYSQLIVLQPEDIPVTSADESFLRRVMEVMEQHLDDPDFSVDDLQREISLSRMQLHRKLKALTGYSTTEFIRIQRLKRAAYLLERNVGNVSEICYMVGFNSLSYFTKVFKEQYGILPSLYGKSSKYTSP